MKVYECLWCGQETNEEEEKEEFEHWGIRFCNKDCEELYDKWQNEQILLENDIE